MKAQDIIHIALGEVFRMGQRILEVYSRVDRMSADEARLAADRILSDVSMDEAVERSQFNRLRAAEPPPKDDSQG